MQGAILTTSTVTSEYRHYFAKYYGRCNHRRCKKLKFNHLDIPHVKFLTA